MTLWVLGVLAALVVLGAVAYVPLKRLYREIEFERAHELFALQRERLEAKFVDLAGAGGKPKGLQWDSCEFYSQVRFVRHKTTGQLSAFVEMTVKFAPTPGGGMENVPAATDCRHATAVFHYQHGQWGTNGRVLFNMTPDKAIANFEAEYEPMPTT